LTDAVTFRACTECDPGWLRGSYHGLIVKRPLLIALTIGAGIAAAAPTAFKRAFRPPWRDVHQTPLDFDLPEDQVWFDGANGIRLHGWFIPVQGTAPAVVVLHGWGGNAAHMLELAPSLHEAGFHALFLDARNHGLSEHDDYASMPRFAEDLSVAVDYLHDRQDVTTVGVIGHSVGAGAAIFHASQHDNVDAVVAVSCFAHPGEMMAANFGLPAPVIWSILRGVELLIGRTLDAIAARNRITEVSAPVMLVHGDDDEVVPVDDSRELADLHPASQLIVVPGGTHSDLAAFEPYFPEVMDFLVAHLGVPSRDPTGTVV
jgi:pimeloyl-ACP methyl ester carboxylesterase